MDIDTSTISSSRKNLVVLSMGFILFSLGEATLGNGKGITTITILAGSITFNNPSILAYFSWAMFFWFFLRFWQFSNHKHDWSKFTETMFHSPLMKRFYLKNKLKYPGFPYKKYDSNTYHPIFGDWKWPTDSGESLVITKNQIYIKLKFLLYISITTELFGQFYFPYCLAIAALVVTI